VKILKCIKFLSVFVLPLVFYPLMALISGAVYDSPYIAAAFTAVFQVICCMGWGSAALLEDFTDLHPLLGRVLNTVGGIIAVAAFIAAVEYSGKSNGGYLFFGIIIAAVSYLLGGRAIDKNDTDVMDSQIIAIHAAAGVISIAMLYLTRRDYYTELYIAAFLIQVTVFAFAQNQDHIGQLMRRRHHSENSMPDKIRGYNAFLVAVIAAVGLVLFIFRKKIAAALSFIIKTAVKCIVTVILWIIEMINRVNGGSYRSDYSENYAEREQSYSANGVIDLVFGLVIAAAVIFIFLKYHRAIDDFIQRLIQRLTEWLRSLVHIKTKRNDKTIMGYEDTYEYVSLTELSSPKGERAYGRGRSISKWKRECRKYKRSENTDCLPVYRLVLKGARLLGQEIPESATSFEAAEIISALLPECSEEITRLAQGVNNEMYRGDYSDEDKARIKTDGFRIISALEEMI